MTTNEKHWSIVAMLCASATASYICRVNVSTAAPLIMNEFGLTQVEMGRVFSAFLLGYALLQIPAGALADRFGAKKVLMIAAWMWGIITILQTLVGIGPFITTASTALFIFMIFRFFLGITEAPTYPGSAQGVSRWVIPKFQGRANGIVIGSIGLGSAIAPPLVSYVLVNYGWRISLIVSAIPAIIIALLWNRIKEPQVLKNIIEEKEKEKEKDEVAIEKNNINLRSTSFILLTISYTLQGYVGYIFVSWFYLYLVQERHFGLLTGAWMSSLPWVLSIVSIPLGGFISDKLALSKLGDVWGRRIVPVFGLALSGILISIGAHTNSAAMAAISLAFATAFVLCVEGPFWAMMMRISGKKSGTAGGIMNMGSNIGGLISPALTPILATIIGWEYALHVAAVLSIIAALLWLGVKPVMESVK
jgi:MFS transporter, ACS family, glucarate transporter